MGIQDGSLYLHVSLGDVQSAPVTESTLFLESRDNYVVFREAGSRVDRQDITRLKSSGVETLYVLCTDGSEIDNYVDRHLTEALSDPNLGSSQKAHILTVSSAAIALCAIRGYRHRRQWGYIYGQQRSRGRRRL